MSRPRLDDFDVRCSCGVSFKCAPPNYRRHRRAGTSPLCAECVALGRKTSWMGGKVRIKKAERAICWVCANLPHRRARGGFPCRCGGVYEAEQPPTIADVMDSYVGPGRTYPSSGAF
jgi:hypothetical protein